MSVVSWRNARNPWEVYSKDNWTLGGNRVTEYRMEVTFMAGIFEINRYKGERKLNVVRYIYYIGTLFAICRTIILPFVSYGCETWSLTLREERRPRVFENGVLRRIFGSKREEVKREWRKLHIEELNDVLTQYCSGDKIEKN